MAIVNGNNGDNILTGNTNEADTITGFNGNDTLFPFTRPPTGGGDLVLGGAGFDTLHVFAQGFTEALSLFVDSGDPTNVFVRSTKGSWYIDSYSIERINFVGGYGDDVINTGTTLGGLINGDAGIDLWIADLSRLKGDVTYRPDSFGSIPEAGFNEISGIDRINLTTGSGRDLIAGGDYADTIYTGAGNDTANPRMRDPAAGGDFVDMGAGFDRLDIQAPNEVQAMSLFPDSGTPTTFFVRSTSAKYYVDAYNVEYVNWQSGSGDDVINTGTARADIIASSGMDTWIVDGSALTVDVRFTLGFSGSFPNSTDIPTTVQGVDRINMRTGSGRDFIVGGAQGDEIRTAAGNDTVNAGSRPTAGAGDFVDMGTGIDTLVVSAEFENAGVSVTIDSGNDTSFYVRSASNNFYVDAVGVENVDIETGHGDDTINTGSRARRIDGGDHGIDWWLADYSAAKVDMIYNIATTHFWGIQGFGPLTVFGIDRISLTSGSGNDQITGGSQGDRIITNAGNDIVNAGTRPAAGAGDFVDMGSGIDTLVVSATAETQSVFLSPDSGTPTTFYVRSSSGNFYTDAVSAERVIFTGGNGDDSINTGTRGVGVNGLGGLDRWTADISAFSGNVKFVLGVTDDIRDAGLTLIRNIEQINLKTGSGNDAITGGTLDDHIETGDGNDSVNLRTRPITGGADFANLGNGIDTLIVNAASEDTPVSLFPDSGTPTTFYVRSTSNNFYADVINVERVIFAGGDAGDSINTGASAVAVNGGGGIDLWQANYASVTGNIFLNLGVTDEIPVAGLKQLLKIEQLNLTTGSGNDVIVGGNFADRLVTGAGNDTVNLKMRLPSGAIDVADLGAGFDTMIVDASTETQAVSLSHDSGNPNTIYVRSFSNRFYIDASNVDSVTFTGGAGADNLVGSINVDRLNGGAGADTIAGGGNGDLLSGGAGADTFDYNDATDSRPFLGLFDQISDFDASDIIDLRTIDANSNAAGDQAFVPIFTQKFHGIAGELRFGLGVVEGDIDGDGNRDFLISTKGATVTAADILL